MSKPKKPGTDLAALKARLAKKTKAAEPAAPAADVPPPGQAAPDVPPPGEVAAPVPAPGEVLAAPADVPPPGQMAEPVAPEPEYAAPVAAPVAEVPQAAMAPAAPQAAPAPAPAPVDDPFGGGGMGGGGLGGGFDPDAGLIDSGPDIAPRGSMGLVIFAALLAGGLGMVGGFLGNKIMGTRDRVDAGAKKGAAMVGEVQAIAEIRKGVAIEWDGITKAIATDPAAGAEKLGTVLGDNFDKHPQVSTLFGWQLASMHPVAIKKTFEMYEEATRLQTDLGVLLGFVQAHVDALKAAGGPTHFGVVFQSDGVLMVEAGQPMCGELPKVAEGAPEGTPPPKLDPKALKPCEDATKAVAYLARVGISEADKPKLLIRGYEKGQMQLMLPQGGIYSYAVGLEPNKNALKIRDTLFKRVKDGLERMNKAEKVTLKALEAYADNPTIDGDNPQPDPGEG